MKIDARIIHLCLLTTALGCGDSTGETGPGSSTGDTTGGPTTSPTTAPTTMAQTESTTDPTGITSLDSTGTTTSTEGSEIEVTIEGRPIPDGGIYDIGESVDVGALGTALTVTLDNLGTADLAVTSAALDTGAIAHFALDDAGLDAVVAPGGSTSFTVAFAPTNGGDKEVQLRIDNDDADEGMYTITLRAGSTPNTWRDIEPTAAPSPRFNTALAATDDGRVLLFGGRESDGTRVADTWVFDVEAGEWSELAPATSPPFRDAHAMAYVGDGMVVLFGGNQTSGPGGMVSPLDDTWMFDLAAEDWTELGPDASPSLRFQHGMASVGDGTAILYGGRPEFGLELGDTWMFDGATQTWTDLAPPMSAGTRSAFAFASDGASTLVMVGGTTNSVNIVDETWRYDVAGNTWSMGAAAGLGTQLNSAAAWLDGSAWVTFSGKQTCCSEPVPGTWGYDAGVDTWTDLAPTLAPAPRYSHSMISVGGSKAIMFGGLLLNANNGSATAETWEYVGP